MFHFLCTRLPDLPKMTRDDVLEALDGSFTLTDNLEEVMGSCSDAILVIESEAVQSREENDGSSFLSVASIPQNAIRNLHPYLPPENVIAGGGYVFCFENKVPEVLLIFRRGAWDLPKGKMKSGESIEACALREVGEEIGVQDLRIVHDLGKTIHGYAEDGKYKVKTTRWFLMETSERTFTPEIREGIEKVEWVTWDEARERVTFETLREHMKRIDPIIRAYYR